ncbi:MAG: protein kinase, partial [Pyrinomonadaceae bacterium]|nr:protein kinase [Pyrinomonadaceae bacterium]
HPNIITIYDFGEIDNFHYIATEFIDGQTLSNYIHSHKLNLKSVLDIAVQIASALNEAHQAGIVHRDIKSENIMIRESGLVKILDFGIAKLAETADEDFSPTNTESESATQIFQATSESQTIIQKPDNETKSKNLKATEVGLIIGTANFMSPEQATGKAVDARSDIFSFGIVLYDILTGELPFDGTTALEVINAIITKEPKKLSDEIPPEIRRIVDKCLQKDRENRYQTTKEVLADLQEIKQDFDFQHKFTTQTNSLKKEAETQILRAETAEQRTQILDSKTIAEKSQATLNQPVTNNSKLKFAVIPLLILLLSVGGFFAYRTFFAKNRIESIAVLPFENKNSDADTDYLSDGLAESLIYQLSHLTKLKVSPTSSVFRYKGKETDIKKIAQELGVDAVMTGRMVKRNDDLNLNVELIDVSDNKILWNEQFKRKMSELLATQREMAAEITNKLQLKLSGAETAKLEKKYTENNEAYQLYLKGRFHWNKRTKDDILKGIDYFEQAIKLDEKFALAYVGIANSYSVMPAYSYLSSKEAFPKAKEMAKKAIELDPNLADAQTALAVSLAIYEYNWQEAEKEFKLALQIEPNNANANFRYYAINYLLPTGKPDEAIKEIKIALEAEPLSLPIGANLAAAYLYSGQTELALQQAIKTHDLDINHPTAISWLGLAYNANGKYAEAINLSQKVLEKEASQDALYIAGYAFAKSGKKKEAAEIIKKFKDLETNQYVSSYLLAMIYAALDDKNQAFAELEKSFEKRDWDLHRIKSDPFAASLRNDERFANLLKKMNLEE